MGRPKLEYTIAVRHIPKRGVGGQLCRRVGPPFHELIKLRLAVAVLHAMEAARSLPSRLDGTSPKVAEAGEGRHQHQAKPLRGTLRGRGGLPPSAAAPPPGCCWSGLVSSASSSSARTYSGRSSGHASACGRKALVLLGIAQSPAAPPPRTSPPHPSRQPAPSSQHPFPQFPIQNSLLGPYWGFLIKLD